MDRLPAARKPERPLLSVDGLTVEAADGTVLVDRVTFDLADGEHLAVIGPNGAGKTSLLRALCGLLRPALGSIAIDGRDLATRTPRERACIVASIAQSEQPDARLRVIDYVGLGRLPHEGRASRESHAAVVARAMAELGIAPLAQARLATLSGGERQRAAIARAIAQEPRLLLLDEPTNHLDPLARVAILQAVRRLGITVIAVLHDLALLPVFADRVLVLERGRVVAQGQPREVLAPDLVRRVFGLTSFAAVSPATGRVVTVFDLPSHTPGHP